jgi:BolA protein
MSGTVEQAIRAKLEREFSPSILEIIDESAMHEGHAGAAPGGQTHFRVKIVSDAFRGENRVARQRRVYRLLAGEFAAGVHALSLQALTPEEAEA